MNKLTTRLSSLLLPVVIPVSALAADPANPASWRAQSLPEALALMVAFALVGIAMAIIGYRVFDKFTPGDLHKEIIEHKNIAAAIIGGAVILGVCIIVAAAIIG